MSKNFSRQSLGDISNLEILVKNSITEIKSLQKTLNELETSLNQFLENSLNKKLSSSYNNSQDQDLDSVKRKVFDKIAHISFKDNFFFQQGTSSNDEDQSLLKLEEFLNDFTDSPKSLLKQLSKEFSTLKKKIIELKNCKENFVDESCSVLKREILWASVRTNEVIAKIKDSIRHKMIVSN